MPTKSKNSKGGSAKKPQVKMKDLKPSKDAKGGLAKGVGPKIQPN